MLFFQSKLSFPIAPSILTLQGTKKTEREKDESIVKCIVTETTVTLQMCTTRRKMKIYRDSIPFILALVVRNKSNAFLFLNLFYTCTSLPQGEEVIYYSYFLFHFYPHFKSYSTFIAQLLYNVYARKEANLGFID